MEINLSILDNYFNDRMPVAVVIDLQYSTPCLIFQPTKDPNTGRREFLDFRDIEEILKVNNVYKKIDTLNKANNTSNWEKNFNDLVYDTIAKYVLQMLNDPSTLQILYPELIPIDRHKEIYFRTK